MTTDPITQAREIVSAVPVGLKCLVAKPVDGVAPEDIVQYIAAASRLLRTLTSEGAEEELAREHARVFMATGGDTAAAMRAVISHLLAQAIGAQP